MGVHEMILENESYLNFLLSKIEDPVYFGFQDTKTRAFTVWAS